MSNLTGLRLENAHAIDLHSKPSVLFVEDRDIGLAKDDKEVSFAVVFQILSHMEVSAHAGSVTRTKFGPREDWKSQLRFRPRWRLATSGKLLLGRRGACGGMRDGADVEDPMESG